MDAPAADLGSPLARRLRRHPGRQDREDEPPGSALDQVNLLDLSFDAAFVRDFRTHAITSWNRAAVELYGWEHGEAVGRPAPELLQPRYPVPIEQIERRLARDGAWHGRLTQRRRDGRELLVTSRWVLQRSQDGAPRSIVQLDRDLTGRSPMELRKISDDSFRLLVSSVRDYAIFMLDPDGVIVSWNEGAQRIKGYRADEIIGKHFSVFYEPANVEAGQPDWELIVADRDGRFEHEGWRVRRDGTRFWANVVITALRDGSGALVGFGKVTRDMTDRKAAEERRVEEQRREAAQFREHAERMRQLERTKSDFLNLASHELRGPLAIVRGYLSMFEDGTLGPDELFSILPTLTGKVQQIELLVQQMLETARLEESRLIVQPAPFDLGQAARRVVQTFASLTDAHQLSLSMPDVPVVVRADRTRIDTVISNLVDNAVKYSPDGGPISCVVAANRRRAFLSVQDSGIGVAPEAMERLFTRFGRIVTPENSHISGTGLGLYLSREIARRHGGDILVESSPGRGSRFTLTLPLARSNARPDPAGGGRTSTLAG